MLVARCRATMARAVINGYGMLIERHGPLLSNCDLLRILFPKLCRALRGA
jgi:hypothetical protein